MDLKVFDVVHVAAAMGEVELYARCPECQRPEKKKGLIVVFLFNNTYQRILARAVEKCPTCGTRFTSVSFFSRREDALAAVTECLDLIASGQSHKDLVARPLDDIVITSPSPVVFDLQVPTSPHPKCDS